MPKVTVDEAMSEKLGSLSAPVAICDRTGRTLGHFVPLSVSSQQQQGGEECPYSVEELSRMRQESGGRTLEEIWKSLGRT